MSQPCSQPCLLAKPHPSTVTCNSSRWICSESSWMSESRDRAGLGAGGVNTSSFRGALRGGEGEAETRPLPHRPSPHGQLWGRAHLRADFVAAQDKGHLAAPRMHEAGPAGVHGDILAIPGTEADRGVVKGLARQLQD